MSRSRRRSDLLGFCAGLLATVFAIILALGGLLDWLEHKTLDLRFCIANSIPEHPDITIIAVDDASLHKVQRWPWHRDEQAGMLSVLAELGARALLIDFEFLEPQTVRLDVPAHVDLLVEPEVLAEAPLPVVLADDALARAIAAAGNVYVAVHYNPDSWEDSAGFEAVLAAVRAGGGSAIESLRREARVSANRLAFFERAARVVLALEEDFTREDAAVAGATGLDPNFVRRVFERCRLFALREWIRAHLAANEAARALPPWELAPRIHATLSPRAFEDDTPLKAALLKALSDVLSYDATVARPWVSAERAAPAAVRADAIVPVYYAHALAARACGFVAFQPDEDGVLRRNALFAVADDHALPQIAFQVACDVLGIAPEQIDIREDAVVLPATEGQPPLRIQLDAQKRFVMPWIPQRDWTLQFSGGVGEVDLRTHVPADVVWTVQDRRRQRGRNNRLLGENRAALFGGGLFPQSGEYAELLQRRDESTRRAVPQDEAAQGGGAVAELDARLGALEREIRTAASDDSFLAAQVERLDELAADVAAANARLDDEIKETLRWLRPRIENKICLLGYTATSVADMTPIPTHKRAPGVLAHANLLNGLLVGRMISWAPPWLNALVASLCGALVSLVAIRRTPREAALWTLVVIVLLALLAGWLFYAFGYWLAITGAFGAALLAYLTVAAYRYFFIERERRQLTTVLGQYTSATLARQMAENAELCRRAETREVSAMFTDLRGFTTLSERIGAQQTQHVLNVCLGRLSEVLLRHEAMINKFIGDGIFAFWNPLIHPQPNHTRQACEAALDLLAAMRDLIAQQQRQGEAIFGELHLRIGVATGPAVVGPCGSEQKYDYTCIGDTVNLAARLESANKFYGTQVLVGPATQAACRDAFVFRPLGSVQVKGKSQPAPIFELLGRAGEVEAERVAYADSFGEAVTAFQARAWARAAECLKCCRDLRPEDLAVLRYMEATQVFLAAPPADEWHGALELTEK